MVSPYPFERLPKVTRRQTNLLRRCARRLPRVDISAGVAVAAKLLGAPVSCTTGLLEICPTSDFKARLREPLAVALLEQGTGGPADRLLVDAPPQFAALSAERALGGDGEMSPGQALLKPDDLSRGVLGYIAARVLHALGSPFHLRAILTEAPEALEVLGDADAALLPVAVQLRTWSFDLRLWIPNATGQSLNSRDHSAPWPALDNLQISLTARAGAAGLTGEEIYSLYPKDVVVLDRCDLSRNRDGWSGVVELMLAGAGRTRWKCRALGDKLCISSVETSQEAVMEEGRTQIEANHEQVLKMAGDAPVELAVELARFTLTLEELGRLRPGEVLQTRRPIGERVTLRAGGYAVASGELVDVEGEVGVRILALAERNS